MKTWDKKSKLPYIGKLSFKLWVLCLSVFFLNLSVGTNGFNRTIQESKYGSSPLFIFVLLLAFIAGVSTFILSVSCTFLYFLKHKSNTKMKAIRTVFLVIVIIIGGILALGLKAYQTGQLVSKSNPVSEPKFEPSILTPTTAITITPVRSKTYIQPTTNPNPLVSCTMNANCGGGTKLLEQSICNNSTCCQIGNTWTFYEDKNKCKQDQNAYWTNYYNNSNYVVPTYAPLPTYAPIPTYSIPSFNPSPTYSYQPDNTHLYYNCVDNVNNQYNSALNQIGALGAGDSSVADQIEATREEKLKDCANLYQH